MSLPLSFLAGVSVASLSVKHTQKLYSETNIYLKKSILSDFVGQFKLEGNLRNVPLTIAETFAVAKKKGEKVDCNQVLTGRNTLGVFTFFPIKTDLRLSIYTYINKEFKNKKNNNIR